MLRLPDPDCAVDRLAPLFSALYHAFEHGCDRARSVLDTEGAEDDPHVFAAVARFHAIPVLNAAGRDLEGFARTPLMNSGIQFSFGGYVVRVWKTGDGALPAATSSARLRFVRQLPLSSASPEEAESGSVGGNLVVQWEYHRATGAVDLTLACPKPGNTSPESVDVFWSRPIPHPGEGAVLSSAPAPDDVDDLHIIRAKDTGSVAESS